MVYYNKLEIFRVDRKSRVYTLEVYTSCIRTLASAQSLTSPVFAFTAIPSFFGNISIS
jgi:hypothetical protein